MRSLVDTTLLVIVFSAACCHARSPWDQPVKRQTDDRNGDLVDALIVVARFDDAAKICRQLIASTTRDSDSAAKWSIRLSEGLSARQLRKDSFDDPEIELARRPVVELANEYPEHRRRLFLDAQAARVLRDAALHSVLRAAVSPTSDATRDIAVRRLLTANTEFETLSARIAGARATLDRGQAVRDFALDLDFLRLQQELQVDAVSLSLMQTELFAHGSDDRIAAATRAEQAAKEAMATLPADIPARLEVERLRVEAILRSEQFRRADDAMDALLRLTRGVRSPRALAMMVRLDLGNGRLTPAKEKLDAYFGQTPDAAPRSIEMDLARLEFLLRGNRTESVGDWLDQIERRGGGYARRRAEALSLAFLRSGTADRGGQATDPSIVAAQGQDWLRRGEPGRAADLLSAAAEAETDPDRAIQRAGQAAATLVAADRQNDAVEILTRISLANPEGTNAAATHLQAIFLVSSMGQDDAPTRLEKMLREHLKQWSSGPMASSARKWLAKVLTAQRRFVEAAETVTRLPLESVTPQELTSIAEHWRTAFRSRDRDSRSYTAQRMKAAFEPLLSNPQAKMVYRRSAALWVDRNDLNSVPKSLDAGPSDMFVDALLEFRVAGRAADALKDPPQQWVEDATIRLMEDGRTESAMRGAIAEVLANWIDPSHPSLDQAERLIWMGKSEEAIAMIRQLVRSDVDSSATMRQAAMLLGGSRDQSSRLVAIQLWDELASGTRQGTRLWHQAKLAAIKLLQQTGDDDQARKRAKYILLIVPTIDEEFKWQYEAAVP